jgi:hypothetical protein
MKEYSKEYLAMRAEEFRNKVEDACGSNECIFITPEVLPVLRRILGVAIERLSENDD